MNYISTLRMAQYNASSMPRIRRTSGYALIDGSGCFWRVPSGANLRFGFASGKQNGHRNI
ncbi:MAG: hypothetical protein K9G61_01435 [Bacteroidales bacterium]|nr:hypothetical protein [Bacteroidales bacterium]